MKIKDNTNKNLNGVVVKQNETYTVIDNEELTQMITSETILHPGKCTSGHSHAGQEEVYVFLSGKGKMQIDDEFFEASKGSVFAIPDGAFHKVYNDSEQEKEDLIFIAIFNGIRQHKG